MNTKYSPVTPEDEPVVAYPAYYVESSSVDNKSDESVLIAVDVKIRGDYIEWFDTQNHRRFININTTRDDDGSIQFINSKSGMRYRLTPLTLELYNLKAREKMYGENLDFSSDQELWEALLSSTEDI